jgi:hypothetical protein
MSPAEIGTRTKTAFQFFLERHGVGLARPPTPLGSSGRAWAEAMPRSLDPRPYVEAADRILGGQFDVFALRGVALGFPPRWNRDPKTGIEAPLTFGKTLNYRDERVVGDIKYLWEPNRHLELVTLAQAWHLTGDPKYAGGCRTLLRSWFQQCPYPSGANWTSALEHSVRLLNWAVAWHLLGGEDSPLFKGEDGVQFRADWLNSVYCHCHFIAGHPSRHSSANNHLLGELMGLFIAAVTWPMWPESALWRRKAGREFEEEALKQNAPDGVNREQAVWYHHEVADMMLLVALFGRANGVEVGHDFWERLEAMLEFIRSVMDAGGNVPMIGDADDAVMVRFSRQPEFNPYRSLLATGAVLFGRADFKAAASQFDDKSRWLLGDEAALQHTALEEQHSVPTRAFPESGYYILGSQFDSKDEIRVVADAGPLGYLSIAAHGHADALAFTLSVRGYELLVDSGTYAYHTQKRWRDYFRGTSAHNTIRVDKVDQSVSGGNFLWLRKANARCLVADTREDADRFVGEHDGYRCLSDPVIHRRELSLDKSRRKLIVVDILQCSREHDIEQFWHFAEACQIEQDGPNLFQVRTPDTAARVHVDSKFGAELVTGDEERPLGWISRRYDERERITTVVCSARISGETSFITEIFLP